MSLAKIFTDWNERNADILSTAVTPGCYEDVAVGEAVSRAVDLLDATQRDDGAYIVPLFKEEQPHPTNEYVLYRAEKGQIGWFDTGFGISGVERFVDVNKVAGTVIGQRLRYWLPEHSPDAGLNFDDDELPAESIQPANSLSRKQEDDFFDGLRTFVANERDAKREQTWETYTEMGFDDARRRHRLSGPFIYLRNSSTQHGNRAYQYQIAENENGGNVDLRDDEGLFEGNICIADIEDDSEHFPLEVRLASVGDSQLKLCPTTETDADEKTLHSILGNDNTVLWLHELLNPVPYNRRTTAIKQVEEHPRKRNILTGNRQASFSLNKYALPEPEIELNDYQLLALTWADAADDVVCIHGPPGTGKTRTLTAYILHAVATGKKVLVTAHSNQAVDNLLVGESTPGDPEQGTLHAVAQDGEKDISIARTGSNLTSRVVTNNYSNRSTKRADIVASTTSGAAQFDANQFDVAVVDEATQASRPATAIALNAAEKLVLAGDHKQLPPFHADEDSKEEGMHISLFEYLLDRYGTDISVLLQKQYRMHEDIAAISNEEFYDGRIETAVQNRSWTLGDLPPVVGIDVNGTERRSGHNNSYQNRNEGTLAAAEVQRLVDGGTEPSDIGVITAYSGQKGEVINQVNGLDIDNPRAVTVDTVDSFQGGEREAIIVSFVRSNDDGHSGFLAFPEEGPRRLNVAITRARRRLVLIGNWDTLGTVAPHRSEIASCAPLYADIAARLRDSGRMLTPAEHTANAGEQSPL